jgi:hypothetical protein
MSWRSHRGGRGAGPAVVFDFSLLVNPHLGARLTEEGVMQWFTVPWWRWRLAQARGRNALVRASDRVEVAIMVLAVVISLTAIPFAGAIATAVHETQARTYAAEQQSRRRVVAATTDDNADARRQVGDVENVRALVTSVEGPRLDTWVDQNGRRVGPPPPFWQAGADAVVAAVGFWLGVTAVTALLVAAVRGILRRARDAGWNRDIASLIDDDGGRTNRQR